MNRKLLSRHLVVSLSFCRAGFCVIPRHLQQLGECCYNFYNFRVFYADIIQNISFAC